MISEKLPDHIVYSQPVVEFVTVAAETCLFLEKTTEQTRSEFVSKAVKILPLLYLKAAVLEIPAPVFDSVVERFVTEEDYLFVKEQLEQLLGADDSYLEVFHPDMALSDTPIAAFVSESLADVYQEIKDFAANYQTMDTDVMNDALVMCLNAFGEHWGQKALSALRALHAVRHGDNFNKEDQEDAPAQKIDRNSFFGFLKDENEDDLTSKLL
ncbi:MAG: DUF5063 domain-containing protein [Paludibacter sp.]|nr:DUF5063 domain-containing protein [Paludibacter sp.]